MNTETIKQQLELVCAKLNGLWAVYNEQVKAGVTDEEMPELCETINAWQVKERFLWFQLRGLGVVEALEAAEETVYGKKVA